MPPRLPPVATPTEGRSVLGGSYGRCPFASDAPFVRQTLRYAFPHEGAPRSSGDPADGVPPLPSVPSFDTAWSQPQMNGSSDTCKTRAAHRRLPPNGAGHRVVIEGPRASR